MDFKTYRNNNSNTALKNFLRNLQVCLNSLIECAKEKVYHKIASKFHDTQKNAKSYWSLIKIFLNNNTSYSFIILYSVLLIRTIINT